VLLVATADAGLQRLNLGLGLEELLKLKLVEHLLLEGQSVVVR